MKAKEENRERRDMLPGCVAEFLSEVVRHMRYRRPVREEVRAELTAHFADELRGCASEQERLKKAQEMIAGFGDVKLLATLLRRAKRRCRSPWQTAVVRTMQIAAVLVACLIVYVVWFLAGRPVITTDYVAQFNSLVRPHADESLNAAPFYIQAAEIVGEPAADIAELLKREPGELDAEQKRRFVAWFAERQEMLELVATGAQKPHYWRVYESEEGMISVLLPHVRNYRYMIRALSHRAVFLAGEGRQEEAFSVVQTCYRCGRHLRAGDKTLIEQNVGIRAEDRATSALLHILSEYRPEPAQLAAFQKEIEALFAEKDFALNVASEKLIIYDEIQRCFTAGLLGRDHLYPRRLAMLQDLNGERAEDIVFDLLTRPERWGTAARILFVHPDREETRATFDRAYDLWNDWLRKTPAELRNEGLGIVTEIERTVKGNSFLEVIVPAYGRLYQISWMTKVRFDAALAIVALLRYEAQKGEYPEDLNELVTAGYLGRVPMDPWSSGSLTYRRAGGDFLLYAWGDFSDDGGQPAKGEDDDGGDAVFWPVP